MAWTGIFKDAATSGKRELTVKRESYNEADATAIETWSDETLFKVRGLNHLRVMGFVNMKWFSPLISKLNSLLEVILTNNGLESLPDEISTLTSLRHLDVSHNHLNLLPVSFYQLKTLQKLLLGYNELTDDSFPDDDQEIPFPNLQHVNLTNNKLSLIPQFIYKSHSVIEMLISYNQIDVISCDIAGMTCMKTLEMTHNCLRDLPSELSQCSKLRTMIFNGNPLEDKRLIKILQQFGSTKPKAVLDYLQARRTGKGKGGKKNKGGGAGPLEDDVSMVTTPIHRANHVIRVVRPSQYVIVKSSNAARRVRPYLVCAIARDIHLDDDGTYRLFITLQTKLHDTVCKRRRVSTIATHSLESIAPPLSYACRIADKINFQPLGWQGSTTVRRFLSYLRENGQPKNGGDKPYSVDVAASNISKFLPMIDPTQMVHLADSQGTVISLPPLTNSEPSKISESTRDIFIEVTSSTSLADAKQTMDCLIFEMIKNGIKSEPSSLMTTPMSDQATPITYLPELKIEQVKVIDEVDKLLVLYPARPDLLSMVDGNIDDIEVIRP